MFRHSASSARTSSSSLSSLSSSSVVSEACGHHADGAEVHHNHQLHLSLASLRLEEFEFDGADGEGVRVDIEHSETRRNRRGYTERTGKYTQYTTTPPGDVMYGRRS